jgi:transcriptional regulator with XRE-family HTH domain
VGQDLDGRIAQRLAELRQQRGWSLDELSGHSGVSRSALSRLERAEISPTTTVLSQLCAAYGRTASQLLAEVEDEPPQVLKPDHQPVWRDDDAGFIRRSVSPPQPGLRGELVECTLRPGADIAYATAAVPGLEQHIWVLDGTLELSVDDRTHVLDAGDCLRFRLWGPSRFRCPADDPVRYALVVVLP